MPISVRIDPFSKQPVARGDLRLLTPQARVLAVLLPEYPEDPPVLWPMLSRAVLSLRAGYTAISGTTTRALHGVRPGGKNPPHPGLLARGMVEEMVHDVMGTKETSYRITDLGIRALNAYVAANGGKMPELRDRATSINDRYQRSKAPASEPAAGTAAPPP